MGLIKLTFVALQEAEQDQDRNGVIVTNGYDYLGRLIARQRHGTDEPHSQEPPCVAVAINTTIL